MVLENIEVKLSPEQVLPLKADESGKQPGASDVNNY